MCEKVMDTKRQHEEKRELSGIHLQAVKPAAWQRWHLIPSAPDRAKAIKEAELSVAGLYEARAGAS